MAKPPPRGQVTAFFATPVIFDELDQAAELNRQLAAAILRQRDRDAGLSRSIRGGWQSKRDFPQWSGTSGARLVENATRLASANTTSTGPAGVRWFVDSWANVSDSGAFNTAHIHGGTYWSCVYYVSVGEGEGGQLVLHDPRMPALQMHAPHYRFKGLGAEISVSIKPQPGLMVLFPGWVSHHVEPWHGTGTRISVAMNIRAVPPARADQPIASMGRAE